jgi:hypothetical protein
MSVLARASQILRVNISLTPRFSGVLRDHRIMLNRFNGFLAGVWECANQDPCKKPLKRLAVAQSSLNSSLKQGVNERSKLQKNLRRALF